MTSRGASALESLSSVHPIMAGPRHPESPSSLSLLGNGLASGLPSIGPLRSGSANGLPSFGGSLNLVSPPSPPVTQLPCIALHEAL